MGRRSLSVSRSRLDSVEAARLSFRRERHPRLAFSAHQSRSRHRLRYRRQRPRAPRQYDRRDQSGGGARAKADLAMFAQETHEPSRSTAILALGPTPKALAVDRTPFPCPFEYLVGLFS